MTISVVERNGVEDYITGQDSSNCGAGHEALLHNHVGTGHIVSRGRSGLSTDRRRAVKELSTDCSRGPGRGKLLHDPGELPFEPGVGGDLLQHLVVPVKDRGMIAVPELSPNLRQGARGDLSHQVHRGVSGKRRLLVASLPYEVLNRHIEHVGDGMDDGLALP